MNSKLPLAALGALFAASLPLPAQTTPTPPAPPTGGASANPADEVVTLSPFEVVSDTRGYFSANTMSGTRFNTKLEDLAASLTVVTKEQMQDFAMLDINDIFLYTANTEGTGTYTDYVMDRNGQLTDNVQINPTQANRVRGIAAANISYGNVETMGRMPLDPLIMEGVELSRGPNANVFGLGNPSGTVNQVPVSANLSRHRARAEVRADSYEGYRTSLDINRVLRKGVLAVRGSGLFQHDGFVRKPSGIDTVRYNGMVKYQPFKTTTISAAYLYYRMYGNRPNFTPPRDYISYWASQGRPSWDPVAQIIRINGTTIGAGGVGTTTPITADTTLPDYFNRGGGAFQRGNLFIDPSGLSYWTPPTNNTGTSPNANGGTIRFMGPSPAPGANLGRLTTQPLFTSTPSVKDKAMYDWSEINLAAVNRLRDETHTYNIQIDQLFFNTPRHTLAAQFGFMREDAERYKRTPIGDAGISGQTGQLWVDVNERLLDGSVNPFFGRPYIGVIEPRTSENPARWDTYRAQVAYKLDLRQEKNGLRWLGLHQATAYNEYKYRISRLYSFRDVLTSDHAWTAVGQPGFTATTARANQGSIAGGPQAGPNVIRGFFRYYLGDANGLNVDHAPGDFAYGTYPFVWGTTGNFRRENATLGQLATTDSTGGNANLKQIIKTPGGVIQSHFLDGKIVTTFGVRQDKVYSKNGAQPQLLVNNNTQHDYEADNHWAAGDYRYSNGRTKTGGVVVRPFRDLAFLRNAGQRAGISRFLADATRNLAFTYNKSDNFIPAPPAVDLFLNPLPNTTGTGKDYGLWLNALDNRLVIRLNKYENTQHHARDGDANTVVQRVLRLDLDISGDAYQLYDRADAWFRAVNPNWTNQQVRDAIAQQMGISVPLYDALIQNFSRLAGTNDITAKGTELEVNFNPTRFWTVAASGTETKSINTNVSNAVQQWIDQRMPIWTTIVDPQFANDPNPAQRLWWTHTGYGGSQTASQNFATFVDAPYRVIKQQEGKAKPQIRRYNFRLSTNFQLAAITEHPTLKKFRVGGAVRWEDKGAIGYYGRQSLPAIITELDPGRPIWDKAHTYYDAFVGYRTRLWADKVGASFQLNVRNIQESGRLQPVGAFPDGTPHSYRIVDPRQFILTASFDL